MAETPRKSSSDPRSAKEISRVLNTLDERLRQGGHTIAEIAQEVGIPISTIYRWKQQHERRKLLEQQSTLNERVSIDNCIEELCSSDISHHRRVSCLAFIAAWLRWPSNRELQNLGALSVAMRYVRCKTDAIYIDEIDVRLRDTFERFLKIDDLIKAYSVDSPVVPYMNEYTYGNARYNDRDLIAEVANYLILAPYDQWRPSTRPSLNKAFKLMKRGGFRYVLDISESSFKRIWNAYAPASPFIFVEIYGSPLEWLVDPNADDFAEVFDALINEPEAIRLYFSQVKWAIEALRQRMDARAVANIEFPAFPKSLPAIPIRGATFGTRTAEVLRTLA